MEAHLQLLRQGINSSTLRLAGSAMVDEQAVQSLLNTVGSAAGAAYQAFQQDDDDECHVNAVQQYNPDNGLKVRALKIPQNENGPTDGGALNAACFVHPFVAANFPLYYCEAKPEECLTNMCAVALFNLGLARHTQASLCVGPEFAQVQQTLLHQAKDFYLQGHELLDRYLERMPPDDCLMQVYLALNSNLAEVYHALGDNDCAAEWRQAFSAVLLSVPPAETSEVYQHFCTTSKTYGVDIEQTVRA